jgi:hypothetical protein
LSLRIVEYQVSMLMFNCEGGERCSACYFTSTARSTTWEGIDAKRKMEQLRSCDYCSCYIILHIQPARRELTSKTSTCICRHLRVAQSQELRIPSSLRAEVLAAKEGTTARSTVREQGRTTYIDDHFRWYEGGGCNKVCD